LDNVTQTLKTYDVNKTKSKKKVGNFLNDFKRSKILLLMFLPTLIYIIVFRYLPMYGVIISFYDYNPYKGLFQSKFVGIQNYVSFFTNVDFTRILVNTFLLGIYRLIFTFPAPIILALVLNEVRNNHMKKFIQTVSYLPNFISVTVVAGMSVMFLGPTSGIVNHIINIFGGESVYFMSHPEYFRSIYVVTDIWQGAGWGSIIYLAAITSIDPAIYESAYMDGANKFQQIIHITLPSIAQTVVIMFIISTGNVVSIGFEKVFLLQNPAIMVTSDVISTYVYRTGLLNGDFSFATAAGLFNSVISLIFVWGSNYLSKKFGDNSLF